VTTNGVATAFHHQRQPSWTATPSALASNTCSRPAGPPRLNTSIYNFGSTTFVAGSPAILVGTSFRDDEHTVKAGINYRFNWVARWWRGIDPLLT